MLDRFMEEYHNIHQSLIDPERFMIAMIAIVVVTLFGMIKGPLGGHAMPFYWHILEIIFARLGKRMDKAGRPKGDLIFRGFMFTVMVLMFSFVIGVGLEILSSLYPQYSLVELFSLCILLSSGAVMASQGQLYKALNNKKVTPGAFFSIARSTRTDLSRNDDFTITRVGMGMGLRAFDKALVSPIIWYLLAGIAGGFIYAALAFLQWYFGRDGKASGFGTAINTIEKLLGYIPNILSGFFIAFAGILTPTAGMSRAFLGVFKVKGQATYEEGGLPLTAAAYALNVSLGGPIQDLEGNSIKRNWVGPKGATAKLVAKHLHRAVYISFMAHLLFLAALSGALFYGQL